MEQAAAEKRRAVLVISRVDDGFRVYAPTSPKRIYRVTQEEGGLHCTCTEFQHHLEDDAFECAHVTAVRERVLAKNGTDVSPAATGNGVANGRKASTSPTLGLRAGEMFLKRSVSPDGRIDSLSVGFTWPVEGLSGHDVVARVEQSLDLQKAVVERFLNGNGKAPRKASETPGKSAAAPARIVAVGGMNGRWGRRLFLTFDVEGKTVRLFGSEKQLAQAVSEAGFPDISEDIREGTELGLPCRVVTKADTDPRYLTVAKVLPAHGPEAARSHR
jgi:hypothetical protein